MLNGKKLWSINELAIELGRNARTVRRALQRAKPDGKLQGRPAWYLDSAVAALDYHGRVTGRPPARHVAAERFDPTLEAQIHAIEATGADVDALLVQLRGEKSVERRRALIEGGAGRVVGKHERALQATVADNAHSPLRQCYVDTMMSSVLAEIAALCEWTVSPQ
jgi:hypothetical protein